MSIVRLISHLYVSVDYYASIITGLICADSQ